MVINAFEGGSPQKNPAMSATNMRFEHDMVPDIIEWFPYQRMGDTLYRMGGVLKIMVGNRKENDASVCPPKFHVS